MTYTFIPIQPEPPRPVDAGSLKINSNNEIVGLKRILNDNTILTVSETNNNTKVISIPAGAINSYIIISAKIVGETKGSGGNTADPIAQYKLYKTYSGVDIDLIPLKIISQNFGEAATHGFYWFNTNNENTFFYYEPTEDEKTNGFDIKIYIASSGNTVNTAKTTIENVDIFGV